LEIGYANRSIEKVCTNASAAARKHGQAMADKIHQRIDEIQAAESVEEMIQFKIGRCHSLHQNRRNQYAVDLIHPYRLVFEKMESGIQAVNIIEIVDYH